jgi:hypothetical protein
MRAQTILLYKHHSTFGHLCKKKFDLIGFTVNVTRTVVQKTGQNQNGVVNAGSLLCRFSILDTALLSGRDPRKWERE